MGCESVVAGKIPLPSSSRRVGGCNVKERTSPPLPRACMGPSLCSCVLQVPRRHAMPKHPPCHPGLCASPNWRAGRDPRGFPPSPLPPSLSRLTPNPICCSQNSSP